MRELTSTSTDLFVGTTEHPRQVLRVTLIGRQGRTQVTVSGDGVTGSGVATGDVAEIGLDIRAPTGTSVPIQIVATDDQGTIRRPGSVLVAEPGWTMYLISHFHYDPVWWATQAAYAVTWNESDELAQKFRMGWQQPGFALIDTHVDLARRDPDYKFVLAEVDLLKPYWDARPGQRAYLRRLVAEGRLELLGGTYNEPNTNLTSAEVTIRNFVYGAGFQREVFGADPATAWQLDAFGHDPQFPGLAADAGVSSSSWARGPYRGWGPMLTAFLPGEQGWGDPRSMQFPSEFEWIAPSGKGLLTHYMPAHYSAGWVMDEATTQEEAEAALYELYSALKHVAATRNILLPVGTDYTPPNRWLTGVHRHWNDTYVWPRFVCALPQEFFAAVRAELDETGRALSPQTRDMNPVYTGKEVSYIDTKQAHRAAETLLVDAEKFAVFARSYGLPYPHQAFDKAWRHLVFGAHHDAVTGSESDQVYLDLMTNWHEAIDLAQAGLDTSLEFLATLMPSGERAVTVFNPSSWARTDVVTVRLELPPGELRDAAVVDAAGSPVPATVDVISRHPDGALARLDVTFLAVDVPALGYRSWSLAAAPAESMRSWEQAPAGTATIESARYVLTADPEHGGCVSSLIDRRDDRELISSGGFGNALLCNREYPEHPTHNEGPWHLLPTGETTSSADGPASVVVVQTSAIGQRIRVEGQFEGVRYVQTLTLWAAVDRLECRTELHGFAGSDQLFRVQWPADIAGAMPVSEVGNAVIGRGHALIDVDSADHPWTLDNPAYGFFALSSTAKVVVAGPDGTGIRRAISTAEIVTAGHDARPLSVALVRSGVTATTSVPSGPRYGTLAVDSNLPDVRISLGLPEENEFTAAVLASAPEYAAEFGRQLRDGGSARVWVPAAAPLAQVWQPSADLRAVRVLPVLLVAGADAADRLAADLGDATIEVNQSVLTAESGPPLDDFSVAMLNRGTPGFAVDTAGRLHLSLMRSCTGWPSGVWIDPPQRTVPDGSNFQQQHWSHTFDYAIASGSGDWRAAGLVPQAHDFNHGLLVRAHPGGSGVLPVSGSFLDVASDGQVVVTAVKAAGNPMAGGLVPSDAGDEVGDDASGGPGDGHDVTIRLYEAQGQPTSIRLTAAHGLAGAHRLDLLERPEPADALQPLPMTGSGSGSGLGSGSGSGSGSESGSGSGGGYELPVSAGEIVTIGSRLGTPADAGAVTAVPFTEPVQPIYARYWLNNTGTAPAGNLPVTVHFVQEHVTIDAGGAGAGAGARADAAGGGGAEVCVTVASTLRHATAQGEVAIVAPPGWTVENASRVYALGPGAHCQLDARVIVPAGASPGCYLIAAQIEHDGQTIQDLCRVLVGGAGPERVRADLVQTALSIPAGETRSLTVRLSSDAATGVPAQVQLITPWDLWPATPGWNTGTVIAPAGSAAGSAAGLAEAPTEVSFDIAVPSRMPSGQWWAIVKVAAAGRVHFTPAIDVIVP